MSDGEPKRYVPPSRRNAPSHPPREQQQRPPYRPRFTPSNRGQPNRPFNRPTEQNFDSAEFVVTFKTSKDYEETDLPAPVVAQTEPDSGPQNSYKFKVVFDEDKIRDLLRWFRNVGRSDSQAVLEFPPILQKGHRKELHALADNFGLGTSSQGYGDKRFISVYTEATAAAVDVGKISMSEEETRKSQEVWFLVRKVGGHYSKYSHNEINEMVIADKLQPELQELLDKNEDVLANEFQLKCNVSETTNWRDQCKY